VFIVVPQFERNEMPQEPLRRRIVLGVLVDPEVPHYSRSLWLAERY
jgi:hypothetical protein